MERKKTKYEIKLHQQKKRVLDAKKENQKNNGQGQEQNNLANLLNK